VVFGNEESVVMKKVLYIDGKTLSCRLSQMWHREHE